ncbi:HNH endonuclease [Acinetobacter venetianus]|uniref:HNH endonuclease n=1 Tax=Acinetobacter venetianus TaxID=52133 RepID=UPI000775E9DA|nr:HNH endonuclease [Acinetobacter venetianus]KXO84078.1 HNH endonuclease [Acinetobacter venetianus]
MINLSVYKYSSISFLEMVVQSKKKGRNENIPYYKDRIKLLVPFLEKSYQKYDAAFIVGRLCDLSAVSNINLNEKEDLLKLYNYSSKPFINLKNALISLPNNRELNTCQYCTINDVNTLDHIMPKENFPEFVVHPKNLIPVCSQCNSFKSNKWLKNGNFEFLNLYLHILPIQQFLFVNVNYSNSTFDIKFFLKNKNGIDSVFFNIIENHYNNLKLLERFNSKSNEIVSEFENSIAGSLTKLSLEDALECSKATIDLERIRLGFNHYENVLKLELCKGEAFRQYFNLKGYK